jgi:CRP/FNR family transcriptional regulator, cyclic AMP receptor protein
MKTLAQLSPPQELRELDALVTAVRKNKGGGSRRMTEATWLALSDFLLRRVVEPHTCLIRQGDEQSGVYFLESGLLRVFRTEGGDRLQLAVIGAGSLVGEGTFFAPMVRHASVEAVDRAVVWELSAQAFEAMADREPREALAFSMYVGAVLSGRLLRPAGRLSII